VTTKHWIILAAAVIVNLFSYGQMWADKRFAAAGRSRISERRLIAPALIGGLPGIVLGMQQFRHKTQKGSFKMKLAGATAIFAVVLHLVTDWP
jgi:uncharacterized membrane protein YsdA (DUF1294 family)